MKRVKQGTILIVDDSFTTRSIIKQELSDGDFELIEAENGVHALDILKTNRVDLITLDVEMPGMNGFDVCRTIYSQEFSKFLTSNNEGRVPVIFLTATDTLEGRIKDFEVGAGAYVQKPFLKGELLTIAQRFLKVQEIFRGLTALIIEDSRTIRNYLTECLRREGMRVIEAEDGVLGYELYKEMQDEIDLVVTDYEMPNMTGEDFCIKVRTELGDKEKPIIFISGSDQGQTLDIFKAGATDYIRKPFIEEEFFARLKVHLRVSLLNKELNKHNQILEEKVRERTRELSLTRDATIYSLAVLAESFDPATGAHVRRTQSYIKILMESLRKNPKYKNLLDDELILLISKSSILHDIGKSGIDPNVINKPGKLTKDEFDLVKKHTTIGRDIFLESEKVLDSNSTFLKYAKELAYTHHEKWDGTGYPEGLKGQKIPLTGRLMAIADIYDALINKRIYKPAMPHEEVVQIILSGSGNIFDPEIVEAFNNVEDQFKYISKQF